MKRAARRRRDRDHHRCGHHYQYAKAEAIAKATNRNSSLRRNEPPVNAFRCDRCGHWHVGHVPSWLDEGVKDAVRRAPGSINIYDQAVNHSFEDLRIVDGIAYLKKDGAWIVAGPSVSYASLKKSAEDSDENEKTPHEVGPLSRVRSFLDSVFRSLP